MRKIIMEIKISAFLKPVRWKSSWLRYPNLKKLGFPLKKILALTSKTHN